jgi:VIT1/CCC1 family predicted Fe2+/Mn2+ transporter
MRIFEPILTLPQSIIFISKIKDEDVRRIEKKELIQELSGSFFIIGVTLVVAYFVWSLAALIVIAISSLAIALFLFIFFWFWELLDSFIGE